MSTAAPRIGEGLNRTKHSQDNTYVRKNLVARHGTTIAGTASNLRQVRDAWAYQQLIVCLRRHTVALTAPTDARRLRMVRGIVADSTFAMHGSRLVHLI